VKDVLEFVKCTKKVGNPLTMREILHEDIRAEPFYTKKRLISDMITMTAIALVLTVLSPFGFQGMSFLPSFGYWLMACYLGAALYSVCFYIGVKVATKYNIHSMLIMILVILIGGFLMCFIIVLMTYLYFGFKINLSDNFFAIYIQTLFLGGVISAVVIAKGYIKRQNQKLNDVTESAAKTDPALKFMEQIPQAMRGVLYCLETDDHYLKIHTDKGQHMILMRMKDAISMLEGHKGLQVHRSWWVSEDAITGSVKEGRKVFLTLKADVRVPISKTYLAEVKSRNLL
jgi:hypothetical protein